MTRLVEIRTYRLKPGSHSMFHRAMRDNAVPFIRSKGMDVVAFGRSDHEEETYFLIRSYRDRETLEREQALFYGSSEWKSGPRLELLEHLETYVNTILELGEEAVESMRRLNAARSQ